MTRHLLLVVRRLLPPPWKCSGGFSLRHARDRDSCINCKQFLKVIGKTQPRVVNLKNPVSEGFDQPYFAIKRCKAQKIGKHTHEGLFAISGGDRECGALLSNSTSRKGRTGLISISIVKRMLGCWLVIKKKMDIENKVAVEMLSKNFLTFLPHLVN